MASWNQGNRWGGAPPVSSSTDLIVSEDAIAYDGQTDFVLTHVPTILLEFTVNGVKYILGPDFSVTSSHVTWNNFEFSLSTGDEIEVVYLTNI